MKIITIISMNKQKLLFNLLVFLASLCLIISVIKQDLFFSILALSFALGAQIIWRKWYPRKIYSYREIMEQRKQR